MIDALLHEIPGSPGLYDISFDENGDIASGDQFDTAIVVSLFSDARADESQVAIPELRRGWIGNEETPGDQLGGYLWLFEQSRLTGSLLSDIEDAARGSLRWKVEDGYAESVSAKASREDERRLRLEIQIAAPTGEVETKLFYLWRQTGAAFEAEV